MKKKLIIISCVIIGIAILITLFVNQQCQKKDYAVENIVYEYFKLNQEETYGVINKKGELVIDTKYDNIEIPNPSIPVFFCYQNQELIVLNDKGEKILKEYETVMPIQILSLENEFEKNVLIYQEEAKYGMIDFAGAKLTEAKYETIDSLPNRPGEFLVKENGKYGVLDQKGKVVIQTIYDSIVGDGYSKEEQYQKAGYIVGIKQKDGYQYGYIHAKGNVYVKPQYEELKRIQNETDDVYLMIRNYGRYGIIKNKKKIVECQYTDMQYYEEAGVYLIRQNEKYGVLNLEGRMMIEPEYDSCQISGNYILAKKEDDSKLFDVFGNQISTEKYESITAVKEKPYYIAIDKEGKYSIVTKDQIIENDYTSITYAFDDYFIFEKETGKSGILDAKEGEKIDAIYDYMLLTGEFNVIEAGTFDNNLIDIYSRKLEKILSLESAIVEMTENGYLRVVSENTLTYLDKDGAFIDSSKVYEQNKLYSVSQDGKWGFMNQEEKIVVEPIYDLVTEMNEYGFAGIKKDGLWGVIDENGNEIVTPQYDLGTVYTPIFIGKFYMQDTESKECIEI